MSQLFCLVKAAKKHDEEALEAIFQQFKPKIKQCSQLAPRPNREDLEQELKIQIIKAIVRFQSKNTPGFQDFLKLENNS